MINLIACLGKNGELGKDGKLIFRVSDDLRFFKTTTLGHKVIMGRKTWDSLPAKLPNRTNIVISHHPVPGADQATHDIKKLIDTYRNSTEEVFVIGGGAIYATFLPYAHCLYLTRVDAACPTADTFFPKFNPSDYIKSTLKEGKNYEISQYAKIT